MTKAIANPTEKKVDAVADILVVAAIGAGILLSRGGGAKTATDAISDFYSIRIDNLTINM